MIGRRAFVRNSVMGASGLLISRVVSLSPPASSGIDSRIEVLLDESLGTISPNLYGHFAEHLGGVIYEGIWVGPNSKVPTLMAFAKTSSTICAESRLLSSVIRAGVLPTVMMGGMVGAGGTGVLAAPIFGATLNRHLLPPVTSTNRIRFGTNEFVHFCKLIGAQPYLAANVRSLSAEEFYRW